MCQAKAIECGLLRYELGSVDEHACPWTVAGTNDFHRSAIGQNYGMHRYPRICMDIQGYPGLSLHQHGYLVTP